MGGYELKSGCFRNGRGFLRIVGQLKNVDVELSKIRVKEKTDVEWFWIQNKTYHIMILCRLLGSYTDLNPGKLQQTMNVIP